VRILTANRISSNTAIIPVVITILCLVPFVGKAFHIDDILFIWVAEQIQMSPADFYRFSVNWYGIEMPMSQVTKNPPVASYYVALIALLFGWSEIVLHSAFLIPAAAMSLGTYYLGKELCSRPVLAAMAAVFTPGFLVSSTNIMCDTMMLAFWVWAVFLWVQGMKTNNQLSLFLAAVLLSLSALTKYFGMAPLGLLFVYSFMKARKPGTWLVFLFIPVIILVGYQWLTHELYGRGLLLDATSYATQIKWDGSAAFFSEGLTGLTFVGGCVSTALFYGLRLWSRNVLIGGAVLTISIIFVFAYAGKIGGFTIHDADGVKWSFLVQFSLMVVTGVSILGLAVTDFWESRDTDSLMLLLWVIGTFIFVSFINWTVNARSVLPMVPAVGILIMRRIDHRGKGKQKVPVWRVAWPLIPAVILALSACWADYTLAGSARLAAKTIHDKFENNQNTTWFQGHWGFQYYMEAMGGIAYDFRDTRPVSGDKIIIPLNNTNIKPLRKSRMDLIEVVDIVPSRWMTTMYSPLGAGFYADIWGPLPFAFGLVGSEKYYVLMVK